MFSVTRPTFAAIALLAGIGLANAQTTQEHDAHHPEAGAPAPTTPPASTAGIGMSKMMGGNMEQMMPMMRMMRGMMKSAGGDMRMMPFEHVEGRIDALKMTAANPSMRCSPMHRKKQPMI